MSFTRVGMVTMVVTLLLAAPLAAQDNIRLRLEISKGDTVVARPQISVAPGAQGSLERDGIGKVEFTLTRRTPDSVTVALSFDSDGRRVTPRLVLQGSEPGSISWTPMSGSETVKIVMVWVQ